MAAIDRFLSVLVSRRAEALRLGSGDVALLELSGVSHAITKQPFTGTQVLALLREVAPPASFSQLEAATGEVTFNYASADGSFVARAARSEAGVSVVISPEGGANGVDAAPPSRTHNGQGQNGSTTHVEKGNGTSPALRAEEEAARDELEQLLRLLIQRGGSDLHLRAGEPPVLRLHGDMQWLENSERLSPARIEAMLGSIMPERIRNEYGETNDTDFAHEIASFARFRCNAFRDRNGAGAVFRCIPAEVVTAEQLGLSQPVQRLCELTKGLVLVTGPTGSGKSTTLCALIDLVNRSRSDHVLTIEDPIEFVHPSKKCLITQRQVGFHTRSFKQALRAALREDPDIILVGELRDLETVSIAIETAETGHLVFGTLHTTTAAGTVDRVIDQFPPDRQEQIRVMLAESLKGVISQTLCKKIGAGRVAGREVLLSNPAISNLIREGKTFQIPSIMQTSKKLGMVTLNDALIDLVDGDLVEPQEAYVKAVDKASFLNMLRQRGHDTSFAGSTP